MGFTKTQESPIASVNNDESTDELSLDLTEKSTLSDIIQEYRNSGNISLLGKAKVLESLSKGFNEENKEEINKTLALLSQARDYSSINYLIDKLSNLSEVKKKAKKQTVEGTKRTEGELKTEVEEEIDYSKVPEIEVPEEFIKSLLEANQSKLDWSKKKVSDLVKDASNFSEEQLFLKLSGSPLEVSWNFFDVEPEEWDIYFEEHNIPEEKQHQFKKYYKELMTNKDFGTFIPGISDFGDKIGEEAERINSLGDGEEIRINIDELNPSQGELIFETKKEALLYLYYNKILLREVATFMQDIIVGTQNLGKGFLWIGDKVIDNLIPIFYISLGYIAICTAGGVLRRVNASIINSGIPIIRHLSIGEYLEESHEFSSDGGDTKEAVQLKKRKEVRKKLKDYFEAKGDRASLKIVEDAEKFINVLDHSLDSGTEETKSWKKRPPEGIFWRKLAQLEGIGLFHFKNFPRINRLGDLMTKPLLLNTRGKVISFVENIDRRDNKMKASVLKELVNESGEPKGVLKQAEIYLKRSHNIPNNIEEKVIAVFDEVVKTLKNGNFSEYEKVKDTKELVEAVKQNLLGKIKNETGLDLGEKIYEKRDKLDNAKDMFFRNEEGKRKAGGDFIEKVLDNKLKRLNNLSANKRIQILDFFAEIDNGENEYNQRTALDIVARIIKKDFEDYTHAIDESFEVKWEHVKKVDKFSTFEKSIEELLKRIDNGDYSLELNDETKRGAIDKPSSQTDGNDTTQDGEKKGALEKGKEKATKAYKKIEDKIKDLSLEKKHEYLKEKFGGVKNIPAYFSPIIDKINELLKAKIDKFESMYQKAILEAELKGEMDLARDLKEELDMKKNDIMSDPEKIKEKLNSLDVGSYKSSLLHRLNIKSLRQVKELERLKGKVYYELNQLVREGVLIKGKYGYKFVTGKSNVDIDFSRYKGFGMYLKKAIKTGS